MNCLRFQIAIHVRRSFSHVYLASVSFQLISVDFGSILSCRFPLQSNRSRIRRHHIGRPWYCWKFSSLGREFRGNTKRTPAKRILGSHSEVVLSTSKQSSCVIRCCGASSHHIPYLLRPQELLKLIGN